MTLASVGVIDHLQLEDWSRFEVESAADQSFYHFHTESTGSVWAISKVARLIILALTVVLLAQLGRLSPLLVGSPHCRSSHISS